MGTKTPYEIAFQEEVQASADAAMAAAAAEGLVVGAIVHHRRSQRTYRLIIVEPSVKFYAWGDGIISANISLIGIMKHKDGRFGKHAHWVGYADDVTVLASPETEF